MRCARGMRVTKFLRVNLEWKPDIHSRRKFRFDRQDANDGETAIVKTKKRSFQLRLASQKASPKTVTHHCDFLVFPQRLGCEDAAQNRRYLQDPKKIAGDRAGSGPHRFAPT